jgi:hypothetical protein
MEVMMGKHLFGVFVAPKQQNPDVNAAAQLLLHIGMQAEDGIVQALVEALHACRKLNRKAKICKRYEPQGWLTFQVQYLNGKPCRAKSVETLCLWFDESLMDRVYQWLCTTSGIAYEALRTVDSPF